MKEIKVDIWKDIQGFTGKYQVSYSGQVRRIYKTGKTKILAQFKKAGKGKDVYRDRLFVHLTNDKGKDFTIMVHQIVAKHFLGKPKLGEVPYHVNGCVMDNWASNLEYIDRKKLGQMTGASSRRKPVVKIDSSGEIVECYPSARACAKVNFMSYQTIMDKCNLRNIKRSIFAPDGYVYAWEDDERRLNKVIRLIELETHDEDSKIISNLAQVNQKYTFDF
jgi:hypothetical protein